MSEINFHASSPILRVGNLAESIDYYVNRLGFSVDRQQENMMVSLARGAANLMLWHDDQGNFGSWVYISVGNVEELHEELIGSGAIIKLPPTNFAWAKEIHVADLDGNVLRFGSEHDSEIPFAEWLFWYKDK